jgi:hypothetical protein
MMENLLELFKNVTDVMYQLGIDPRDVLAGFPEAEEQAAAVRVVGAHQPNYPLAENISGLCCCLQMTMMKLMKASTMKLI